MAKRSRSLEANFRMWYRRELHLQVLQNLRSGCIWRDWSQIIVVGQAWLVMTARTLVLCARQEGSFQVCYPSTRWIRHGSPVRLSALILFESVFKASKQHSLCLAQKDGIHHPTNQLSSRAVSVGWNCRRSFASWFNLQTFWLEGVSHRFCGHKQWASQALHPSWQLWFLHVSTIVLVRTRLTDLPFWERLEPPRPRDRDAHSEPLGRTRATDM